MREAGGVFTNGPGPTDRLKTIPSLLAPPMAVVPQKSPSASWTSPLLLRLHHCKWPLRYYLRLRRSNQSFAFKDELHIVKRGLDIVLRKTYLA